MAIIEGWLNLRGIFVSTLGTQRSVKEGCMVFVVPL